MSETANRAMKMDPETLAGLLVWAARNTAYNLEFIPDDRLDWKPSPEALSALEIINHEVESLDAMRPALSGGEWTPAPAAATTREEAAGLLVKAALRYAVVLRDLPEEGRDRLVVVGRRQVQVPLARAAAMPVVDVIHHHGQIAYLQSLLGDTAYHFMPE